MDRESAAQLEAKGWHVGTVANFLDLTEEDLLSIEIKLALDRQPEERQQRSRNSKMADPVIATLNQTATPYRQLLATNKPHCDELPEK